MPTFAIPIDREGVTKKSGAIAQLVEQRTENPCVPGSIPGGTTQKTAIEAILLRFFVYILWPIFRHFLISRDLLTSTMFPKAWLNGKP